MHLLPQFLITTFLEYKLAILQEIVDLFVDADIENNNIFIHIVNEILCPHNFSNMVRAYSESIWIGYNKKIERTKIQETFLTLQEQERK